MTRALEHAAADGILRAGDGLATQRLGADTLLRVVDGIVTGTHEPTDSHYDVLRAFIVAVTLERMSAALEQAGYRTHEFGDSVMIANRRAQRCDPRFQVDGWSELLGTGSYAQIADGR